MSGFKEMTVYKKAFEMANLVFLISKRFPVEERYSLTDQIRRSSRSVSAQFAEGYRKKRYPLHFISKMTDCDGENAETQVWLEFAVRCGYLAPETARPIYGQYDSVLRTLVGMIHHSETWILTPRPQE